MDRGVALWVLLVVGVSVPTAVAVAAAAATATTVDVDTAPSSDQCPVYNHPPTPREFGLALEDPSAVSCPNGLEVTFDTLNCIMAIHLWCKNDPVIGGTAAAWEPLLWPGTTVDLDLFAFGAVSGARHWSDDCSAGNRNTCRVQPLARHNSQCPAQILFSPSANGWMDHPNWGCPTNLHMQINATGTGLRRMCFEDVMDTKWKPWPTSQPQPQSRSSNQTTTCVTRPEPWKSLPPFVQVFVYVVIAYRSIMPPLLNIVAAEVVALVFNFDVHCGAKWKRMLWLGVVYVVACQKLLNGCHENLYLAVGTHDWLWLWFRMISLESGAYFWFRVIGLFGLCRVLHDLIMAVVSRVVKLGPFGSLPDATMSVNVACRTLTKALTFACNYVFLECFLVEELFCVLEGAE